MDEIKINLDIETQTFRFTSSEPIKHDEAVRLANGVSSGEYVVITPVSYTHLTLPTNREV